MNIVARVNTGGEGQCLEDILSVDQDGFTAMMVGFFGRYGSVNGLRSFSDRGVISRKEIDRILSLTVLELIGELKKFGIPKTLCAFKHEFGAIVDGTRLIPGTCMEKYYHLGCGHPELNNIAPYLFIGYSILGWDISGLDEYIYGLLNADNSAQRAGVLARDRIGQYPLYQEQKRLSELGTRKVQELISALEQKFGNS